MRAFDHLHGIIRFNNALFYIGLLFSFLDVTYVFPWVMMGLSISSHWTTVSHHISHMAGILGSTIVSHTERKCGGW